MPKITSKKVTLSDGRKVRKYSNGVMYDLKRGVYFRDEYHKELFTVYTKMPDTARGEYLEEIDVLVGRRRSPTHAKQVAALAIEADYMEGLYPSRTIWRVPGVMFA